MPTVSYFLSTARHRLDASHPLWRQPLPGHRHGHPAKAEAITYARYFSTVAGFCAHEGWQRVLYACSRKLGRPVTAAEIEAVSIFLEKHGAFYHPARVAVHVDGRQLDFVVNVAASSAGRRTLPREVAALKTLAETRPFGWFPAIYAWSFEALPMFLGDWLEGFHEFHLTRRSTSRETAVVVWDGGEDPFLISDDQTAALYRQAAMILAACYHPVTTQHIFPWHHAAGDFVVRLTDDKVSVAMITARDYLPIAGPDVAVDSEAALLDALLLFFLHLTIRMRLDRRDGVAEVVWAPDGVLAPIVDGFFQGLELTAALSGLSDGVGDAFRHYFGRHDAATLRGIARQVVQTTYRMDSEERGIIDARLDAHLNALGRLCAAPAGG